MSVARYLIILTAVAAVILARYLTSGGHIHLPFVELVGYILFLAALSLALGGNPELRGVRYARELVHRKYGFTCVFSLACAVLLTVLGLAWPAPRLEKLPFPTVQEQDNGFREPAAVRAGDSVRVYLRPERRLALTAISGLWKANVIKATLVLQNPRRLLPLTEIGSLPPSETWEDVDPKDGKLYFRPARQLSAIPRFKNEPLHPWIEFRVPYDETLVGKDMQLHVEMTGVLPILEPKGTYANREFRLIEDVPFYVADTLQFAAYQQYLGDLESWSNFQRFRFYAAMTFLSCGALFLWLTHRKPRPSGMPVRMLSRRVGQ